MAATIDHLRVDHHVVVHTGFTDARGISHRPDDHGVIRSMGLDSAQMELWIEWEVNGTRERLHFALQATSGPGNGRMRDYFTLGSEVASEQSSEIAGGDTAAPNAMPPRLQPNRDDARRAPPEFPIHAPAGTSLGDVAVACHCDPAFHRRVLAFSSGVSACMRCGTVTCTHTVGDEGRYTGASWIAHIVDEVPSDLLHWLALWPRVAVRTVPYDGWPRPLGLSLDERIYLPADTRCMTIPELLALEEQSRGPAATHRFPSQRPPGPLNAQQYIFAQFAATMQLTPRSHVAELLQAAEPNQAGCALAVSHLLQRDDAFEVMIDALHSDDAILQGAGAAMAFAATPIDPRLPKVLSDLLTSLPLSAPATIAHRVVGRTRCEELLAVIAKHHLKTPTIVAALVAVQHRVARRDAELASRVGSVLKILHTNSAPNSADKSLK
jgi:hypothetical protein